MWLCSLFLIGVPKEGSNQCACITPTYWIWLNELSLLTVTKVLSKQCSWKTLPS